ncbi:ATP-binding protein [Enterobacter ludwigii]|jgi:two-component system sensor histidine kinase EvgS|uniref:ATP-binding protein n=1 Tax=Enterobacter ludwigii TaxID=299767 RepID=UPI0005895D5F|nr:ATP-binding protein [Enterobacter ludwigii]AOT41811.1 hypothetical protein BH714_00110 [Enterobacter ludwigii]KIF84295.1 hypothetical protein QY91_00110 [Enterobacter ludwigii]QWZ70017.1 response regulator [Enterobacter ludwigii]
MHRGWLATLFIFVLISGHAAANVLRVGLLSAAPPFLVIDRPPGILDDELSILFSNTTLPHVQRFSDPASALDALKRHRIDVVIAAQRPAAGLVSSEPMLTFPLASLSIKEGRGGTLCFPELPPEVTTRCSAAGSASPGEDVRQLAAGKAQELIAPAFILRNWLTHSPATTLTLTPLDDTPPLHFRAWALPEQANTLEIFNERIHTINPEDAEWLEQKWLLPDGSVFDARHSPVQEDAPKIALHVLLPAIASPMVTLTSDGHIQGVWRDLLLNLFPSNLFSLTFNLDTPPLRYAQNTLRIAASATPPSKNAITFDSLSWALLSNDSDPLSATLSALRHKRIAVMRLSPLATSLRQLLPADNLVLVDSLNQGYELLKAGGADGLAGDAFILHHLLRQHNASNLSLTPLALPEVPLWFVPDISDPTDAKRVSAVLASVTQADIYASLNLSLTEQTPASAPVRSLWLVMLAVVAICAALVALLTFSAAQNQRRQRERDTAELHNALSLWQTLMNNVPVPLFVCDPAGRLTRYNDTFTHSPLLTTLPEEGSHFSCLPLGELAQRFTLPHRLSLLHTATPLTGETTQGNTTLYWWLCRYTDTRGRPQGIVGGWVDITEKAALTAALNQALAQAEQASIEKSNFLARMSHDIRTPLNAMLGLLEMEHDKSESLNIAWQAAGSLRDVIGGVLDLSRIEAGELRLEPQPWPLWQTLNASTKIFATSAKAKGLHWRSELNVPREGWFLFDKARLNQIIANLSGNAIKYTPQGEITFQAQLHGEHLQLLIRDTGIGIPAEALPHLGQPWFQTDSSTPLSSGLGLAICYQLVELMGGTLTITSEVGSGTQVTVSIPLPPTNAAATADETPVFTPLPPHRILVVDDFPANLTVLALQLQELGQEVIPCASASEALASLENKPVDILITDCQMPLMDGYQLTSLILLRDIAGTISAPAAILGYTASALQGEDDRAKHAGMDALLRKPLTLNALHQALAHHHNLHKQAPDLSELRRLANGQPEIMTLMRQQLHDAITLDIRQLQENAPSPQTLSQLAHRLKASWSLFAMHNATRSCQGIEVLPEMLAAGIITPDILPALTSRFCARMEANLQQLDAALKELSDKY